MKLFDYNNSELIVFNALKPRSYFLPYKNLDDAKSEEPNIISLNGKWDFLYFSSILDVDENLENLNFNSKIDVPSCWQYRGIEKPFYVNNDYQFPFNPPYLPISTPVGIYKRKILIEKDTEKIYILSFLGANSSTVFINNKKLGYFEGTHNMHEFDITDFIYSGENTITIIMYKWCTGSYLETQDMYRDNGVFRDVYISINPKTYIFDYTVKTKRIKDNRYSLSLNTEIEGVYEDTKEKMIVVDSDGNFVLEKEFKGSVDVELNVNEWNAENPYLYTLYILLQKSENISECIKDFVGFRTIDIKDGVFMVNNTPIKIKGINYHESTPDNGFFVSKDVFLKDINIIKSLNCNCIRFSHYPSNPFMLELCEKYGLYVIDEADIETYGCLATSDKDYVSSSTIFESRFIDRVTHLYERDKNSCAVIMWSIGNESGVGSNLDKAYQYLHSVSNIPVQYETCFRGEYDDFFKNKASRGYDIVSIMYPSVETLNHFNTLPDNRPFYMCEYMHSMGLGPGEMKDVWKYIYSTPKLIGGCVWEYCDHANILENNSDITKRKYLYGGDNDEYIHDSNFCCDGIVLPDRRLSTSAKEMRNIYRPFVFDNVGNDIFITNTNSFVNSSNYKFNLKILKNGIITEEKIINCFVEPLERKYFSSFNYDDKFEYSFLIETKQDDEIIGIDNFVFGKLTNNVETVDAYVDGNVIEGRNYKVLFDERTRTISSFIVNKKEILFQEPKNCGYGDFDKNKKGFLPNIFHAPTDNDRYIKEEWLSKLFDKMWVSFYDTKDCGNVFCQKGIFSPGKYESMFELETSYKFYQDFLKIHFAIIAKHDLCSIPKFGLRVQLNKEFNNVIYYGYGPNENYPDFNSSCYLGLFECSVVSFNETYIRPQENGNRMGTRYLRLLNKQGKGVEFFGIDNVFAFSIHDYSLEDLLKAKHNYELPKRDFYELTLDGFIRGIGSESCGPKLNEKYDLPVKQGDKLAFDIFVKPICD